MLEDLTALVANLGFPIVVALYLLMRVEKKLETLSAKVVEVCRNINRII